MMIAIVGVEKLRKPVVGYILGSVFITLSILLYKNDNRWLSFGLGLIACTAVLMIISGTKELKILNIVTNYTMPIFLMHTLFAAPLRTVLVKAGIQSAVIHIIVGIAISFIGPIVAMKVMKLIKLDWLVYPWRLMKDRKERSDAS